jgi:truncated hemoglobin YjbI
MKACRAYSENLHGWTHLKAFDAIGGQKSINKIVSNLYEKLNGDIVLSPMFKNSDLH